MENRKFVIPFLILALISTVLPSSVFAYEINTHAYLTDEVINFYNRNYENNISDELKDYLIDGSRKEDDNPRWMNHFYDPVKERGLSQDSSIDPMYRLGNWQMSKEWANDDKNQNKLTYKVPTTIASILTTFQEKKISELTTETDFTWDKAIRYWTRGEKEKAMFILGHILHLIEDVSVPDHTRNDPHANGSPYEEWASQFTLENTDLNLYNETLVNNPVYLNNLEDYFNELAKYSNNNFYSKDTIGIQSGYNFPEPIDFELINGYYYGISKDKYGSRYYLVYQKSRKGNFISTNNLDLDIDDELVIKDYWNRLSIKAVQYGAGVVDLFFKEVERAENDPDFVKEEPKSFFAQAIDVMNGLVGNILSIFSSDEDLDLDEEIILDDENNLNTENNLNLIYDLEDSVEEEFNYFIEDEDLVSEITENDLEKQEENNEDDSSQLEDFVINKPTEPEQKICSFETDKPVIYGSVLISEVAWAGTLNSANDEWIELKNTGGDINISGWQLIDKKEQIKVLFKDTTLAGGEFYLLERTDDESVPAVIADYIYTGALSNNDEGLRLFDDECNLIDEVLASPDWPAGDSGAKRTMERLSDLTWHSYSGSGENNIFGTPKKDNSPVVIYHSSGGGGSSSSNNAEENTSSNEPVYMPDILISEIQTSGGSSKDEFIELYNPNNESVDLTNWYIKRKSSSGNEYSLVSSSRLEAKLIPAKGYFLLANEEGYDGDVFVDVS
ncbi:hypothetical protein GW950_01715, partial [Candidatus Wolfebacteria bacterium]|nr:hypothetical protein [Candidatus Wolfebacteria bacterium]